MLYTYKFRLPTEDWLETKHCSMDVLLFKIKEHFLVYHNLNPEDIAISENIIYNMISRPHTVSSFFKHKIIITREPNNHYNAI